MDKNDIINYVMHTPHNTNKAVLSGMLNQLTEGGGGGGSSDFTTAEVTFTSSSRAYAVLCAVILEENQMIAIQPINVDNTPVTVIVPLYKGTLGIAMDCFVSLDSQTIPTVTGGVALDENGVIITADGTFTAVGS